MSLMAHIRAAFRCGVLKRGYMIQFPTWLAPICSRCGEASRVHFIDYRTCGQCDNEYGFPYRSAARRVGAA